MKREDIRRERKRAVRQSRASPGSPDAPAGSDRATGVDDPTPRADYRDEPPEHPDPDPPEEQTWVYAILKSHHDGNRETVYEVLDTDDRKVAEKRVEKLSGDPYVSYRYELTELVEVNR